MDFDFSSLAAAFIFGVLGFWLLKAGRKSANFWHLSIGVALMAYPYFVSGALLTWGVGAGFLGLAWLKR